MDGEPWANFLEGQFSSMLEADGKTIKPKIAKVSIDALNTSNSERQVLNIFVKKAKVQVVLTTPGILIELRASSKTFTLGSILSPERILSLMMNVSRRNVLDDSVLVSSMYSFNEWHCLIVRHKDQEFVREVEKKVLEMLAGCKTYEGYKSCPKFSLCPTKVTQQHSKVYIHLNEPLEKTDGFSLFLRLSNGNTEKTPLFKKNPYTLSFKVPDIYVRKYSCQMLEVSLIVNGKEVGCGELKCEGTLEVIRSALEEATNAVKLMTEAMNFSPRDCDLDEHLASKIRQNIVFNQLLDDDLASIDDKTNAHLPTWLHFGAAYDLKKFCQSLMDVPGYMKLLKIKDASGNTPNLVALNNGHSDLAQFLETCGTEVNESLYEEPNVLPTDFVTRRDERNARARQKKNYY